MPDRNYRAEMNEYIESLPAEGTTASLLADRVINHLLATDPELLMGWLREMAHPTLTQHITRLLGKQRVMSRYQSKAGRFAEAAGRFERGDRSAFNGLYVTTEDQVRKRLGMLTNVDCKFVAGDYTKKGNAMLFEAAVFTALARRIPDGQTLEEALTEDEYLNLRRALDDA